MEEFAATINLMYKIYKMHPKDGCFTLGAMLPYPGSKMYSFSLSQGFKAPEKPKIGVKLTVSGKKFQIARVDVKKVWAIRSALK